METERKKTSSSSSDLKSHPDKLLKDHLNNVGNRCRILLQRKNLNIDRFIDPDVLQEISYLIGIAHDFGKATTYFQEYLNETDDVKREKLKNKPETHHAFISSIFAYSVVKGFLDKKGLLEKEFYKYLPVISFLVVKKHHGDLENADDEIYSLNDETLEVLKKQVKSIDFDILDRMYAGFRCDCDVTNRRFVAHKSKICDAFIYKFRENYNEFMREINTQGKRLIRRLKDEESLFYYFISLLLFSALLDADKMDAANLEIVGRRDIPDDIVDRYKRERFGKTNVTNRRFVAHKSKICDDKKKIDSVRERIYNEVVSKVENLNLDCDKILSLNVPTGMGKTLTSFSFALKLRKRISEEKNFCPRIIYSLPFLSIIDQNSKEFAKVLAPLCDIPWESLFKAKKEDYEDMLAEKIPSTLLLEHHHLSDLVFKKENEFENLELKEDIGKNLLLIEGWNSEVVVTTFMQFFYSFISNKNRMIRKFHNIVNSIIILDEVQAIPHRYWLLLKESIRFFAEHFNTYFIFVTATQPLIFDEKKSEIKTLVDDKREYFNTIDRVDLIPCLAPIYIKDFEEKVLEDILRDSNRNFLIVMNTIDSSKEIYEFIKSEMPSRINNTRIYYLSTNIVPKERLNRINEIKRGTEDRKIIVSTQLIEAGVDIDADVVYRDFAPLDSINQVSGRCNRNFGERRGIVKVFVLRDGAKEYYKYIYDSFIISKTQDILKEGGNEKIPEPNFLDLNNAYFERVWIGQSDDESKKILNNVNKLKFSELSEFKLIEDELYKEDVFVELDNNAKEVWQKYCEIINNKELKGFEKREEFLKIKKKFYEYVISIIPKNSPNLPPEVCGFRYICKSQLEEYYDMETGFKKNSDTRIW